MNKSFRVRILKIIEVGFSEDRISRGYDILGLSAILLNLVVSILFTYDSFALKYYDILSFIELITVCFFFVDYVLRICTADILHPDLPLPKAIAKYAFSFTGIIDLLSFCPYFLPIFFPAGSVAFRILRIVRIFRLFRINAYYDSLNVITAVLYSKSQQLLSSVFIIAILMVSSSLCMYSIENPAQPEVFSNAFSGIWWATSTLLTVGYGDIYPITTVGKAFGIIIAFLGVGMVAIPTGIISAGFVEQYSKIREESSKYKISPIHFVKVHIKESDPWEGIKFQDLRLPEDITIIAIQRGQDTIVPHSEMTILANDTLLFGAKRFDDSNEIVLQELLITDLHPWNNSTIRDLDISRHTNLVAIQRGNETLLPHDDMILKSNDKILLYTKKRISDANRFVI